MINGIPAFRVNFGDFSYLTLLRTNGARFLTRELSNTALVTYIKQSRSRRFYYDYNGRVINFSDISATINK